MHAPNLFMGPSLYEVWPCNGLYGRPTWSTNGAEDDEMDFDPACEPVSSVTREGNTCGADDECWLIHSDMLHEAPQCTGIAHEPRAVTTAGVNDRSDLRSGRVFWYLDGLHEELVRYDLSTGHGPGILDHRSANIRRYRDVHVEHSDDDVSHMVVDEATRSLFIVRPRSGDVLRVNVDSGSFARGAQCVPDECYPAHEGYVPGTCVDGYCTGGRCLHEDGYGCYHIFTETADIFEYEYWTCTQTEVFAAGLNSPAGIAVSGNLVFVSERGGTVRTFDLAGAPAGSYTVTQPGLAGLDAQCEGSVCVVHFVNSETSELGRFEVGSAEAADWAWPAFSCEAPEPDAARPDFAVSHGPGYQSSMVIPFSYGKHCRGFAPGEDPGGLDLTTCPDREDCAAVNGDALLMAGYLCHPCLSNMCGLQACWNIPGRGFYCGEPASATTVRILGSGRDGLAAPRDVATHPETKEVWVANTGTHGLVIFGDSAVPWRDRAPYHYMARVSALAFDRLGLSMVTCQDSKNEYWEMHAPNLFMGPSLYEVWPCNGLYGRPTWSTNGAEDDEVETSDLDKFRLGGPDPDCEPVSSVTREGNTCGADDECWLIHSD